MLDKILRVVLVAVMAAAGLVVTEVAAGAAGPTCYGQPLERIATDGRNMGDYWRSTNFIMVTDGSPCQDVNARGAWDSIRHAPTCADFRIRFTQFEGYATPWRTVCGGWTVLHYGAVEGMVFRLESRGGPASIVIRS